MDEQTLQRYSRQIMLADFDIAGQQALAAAQVAIIGLGGLGAQVALSLSAAGVGQLKFIDPDRVELSNLPRQLAHGEQDIGDYKVESARRAVLANNSAVSLSVSTQRLDDKNALELLDGCTVVVECSDNLSARMASNRASLALQIPLVSAAAVRAEAQLAVFNLTPDSPCYACLYNPDSEDVSLSCAENGVLSPLLGVMGSMQALETMKLIAAYGTVLDGSLQIFDAKSLTWQSLKLAKKKGCAHCSQLP